MPCRIMRRFLRLLMLQRLQILHHLHFHVAMVALLIWSLLFHQIRRQQNQVSRRLKNAVKMLCGVYLSFTLVMRSRLVLTNLIWKKCSKVLELVMHLWLLGSTPLTHKLVMLS
uniref:Uncharacterized protein n=1 Tax=Arundo donax TaxID=35708 RepID=A0A0A9E551_ARUDO